MFLFKVKSIVYFVPFLAAILWLEYFFYTWSASQLDLLNGVYNGIDCVIVYNKPTDRPSKTNETIIPVYTKGNP